MKQSWRQILLVVLVPGLAVVAYGAHLAAGGNWGREAIKAQVALRTTPHTLEVGSKDGADCGEIGEWDPDTRTCALTRDPPVGASILFVDDDVTLDGAGHRMTGTGEQTALWIIGRSHVRVFDLEIRSYVEGVVLQHSRWTLLRNLRIRDTSSHAIHLTGLADGNTIVENVIGPTSPDGHGIALWTSNGNLIAGNVIVGTRDAIRLQSSHGNTIMRNYTVASMIEAIDLHLAEGNTIVFNDLMDETALPLLDDLPAGSNLFALSAGGNHYAQYRMPSQGCDDLDSDGFCDDPYRFFSEGEDPAPSVRRWTRVELSSDDFTASDLVAARPFSACTGCHEGDLAGDVEEKRMEAPDIRSIVGRPIAGQPGFAYSEALRAVGGVWTEALLHRFLTSPQDFAPGTTMTGVTISDPDTRQRIIDQLGEMAQ